MTVSLRHPYRHGLFAVARLLSARTFDRLVTDGMRHRQRRLR